MSYGRIVLIDGRKLTLTNAEHGLFMALYNARGEPVSRRYIRHFVAASVHNIVPRLRTKLAPTKFRIWPVRGVGYRMERKT